MQTPLDILALEPWLGGSHEAFLRGFGARTRHSLEVVGLASRHWKWRMRSSAWELARRLHGRAPPDLLLASDYVDLPALFGFLPRGWDAVPAIVYMHENQLTYPLGEGADAAVRDTSYGFTNVLSCLRAEALVFNSDFHRREFGAAAGELLRRLPRPNPASELRAKLAAARVVAPGVDLGPEDLAAPNAPGTPLRVAFNHRWEHDKDPRAFLEACLAARARGARLELVLLGERFGALPAGTPELLERLRPAILHSGYLPVREDYRSALAGCDLALSTAQHEFFGISTVEALAAGVTPLLPNRLSYPEVVGPALRRRTLYGSPGELVERLCQHAEDPAPLRERTWREALRQAARPCSVESTAAALDTLCLEVRDKSAALPQD